MTSLQIQSDEALFHNAKDKVVVLTGGASGIGEATIRKMHTYGAKIAFLDVDETRSIALAEDLGSNVTFVKGSVTNWSDQIRLFTTAESTYGPIDIVYANAGVDEIERTFENTFDESGMLMKPNLIVLDVSLKGSIYTAKIALSIFRRDQRPGSLVFTASAAGYLDSQGLPIYSAAKHGVVGLARSLRETLRQENKGIRVNIVAPAFVDTPFTKHYLHVWEQENLPINTPDHVASALLLAGLNPDWHGKGIYIAAGTYTELEQPLLDTREQWLGKQNTIWVDQRKSKKIKIGKPDGNP